MDISAHPLVVIISTVSALFGVATSVWIALSYIRKRWFVPACAFFSNFTDSIAMLPDIRAQLFNNGGSTLRDAVDRIHGRLCVIEAREKALIQEHDLAVFIADENGRTTWVNRTYCRLFGVDAEEALGYGWKNSIDPEDRERYAAEWHSAVADRREFTAVARCHHSLDGATLYIKVRAYPLDTPGGNQRGYTGFLEPLEGDRLARIMGEE